MILFYSSVLYLYNPYMATSVSEPRLESPLMIEGIEIETVLTPAATETKRRRTVPAERKSKAIFKKEVWDHPKLNALRLHANAIAQHSQLTTAYFIPIALLTSLKLRAILYNVLTARPKSKKFQGRDTKEPWPMYRERGEWVAIPRQFGVVVFGLPEKIKLFDGLPLELTTQRPLFTAETCKAHNGIDQLSAVNRVETYMRTQADAVGFAACMFCISPGYGKTCCSAHLIARLGRRALFVVPNENPFGKQVGDEMHQFLKRSDGTPIKVGSLITSNQKQWILDDCDIVITTMKSIATIRYDLSSFGTVVIDEGHETATPSYSEMYFRFGARYILVLTATPERAADHCGGYLQWMVGPVVWYEQRDIAKLRWGGVNVTIYNIEYTRPIKETLLSTGDPYLEGITRQLIARESRNRFIINTVLLPRLRAGRRILVLGTRIEHMEWLHTELTTKHRVHAGIIVGEHSRDFRMAEIQDDGSITLKSVRSTTPEERLEQQKRPILIASIAIVSKALNIPELDTMIVLSGGCYVNDTHWRQAIGRITRDHVSKQDPELILLRDRYESKLDARSDGMMATCVDAACRTLRRQSANGYKFETIEVQLD